jgi:hypothetical protein
MISNLFSMSKIMKQRLLRYLEKHSTRALARDLNVSQPRIMQIKQSNPDAWVIVENGIAVAIEWVDKKRLKNGKTNVQSS